MRIYLDDDSASPLLARLLTQAGHDVQRPADVGKVGHDDCLHLTHAILENRVLLSANYDDFENLHDLIKAARGHHPGIFLIRRDNGGKRLLKPKDIVRAIGRFLAAGIAVEDEVHVLNHWQ